VNVAFVLPPSQRVVAAGDLHRSQVGGDHLTVVTTHGEGFDILSITVALAPSTFSSVVVQREPGR
jgi:hypothetical protein